MRSDVGEILVDTPEMYAEALDFVEQVMPHNKRKLKQYTDDVPLFNRFQIESQIENAYERTIRLPSGGALVIDQTEALTAVDVNSARATKGGDIEETAFNTNLEAAEEVARQLRLRDLGGLVVIDFIDMSSTKHQREVENKLQNALKYDRARVQIGRISRFGLLEMSRQRLRPSLGEASQIVCPTCEGHGRMRSIESLSLSIIRVAEEHAMKDNTGQVLVQAPVEIANFLLNEKRSSLREIEARHDAPIVIVADEQLQTPHYEVTRIRENELGEETAKPSYQRGTPRKVATISLTKAQLNTPPAPAVTNVKPAQPAPLREPKPMPEPEVARQQPAPEQAALTPVQGGGVIGWLRGLFAAPAKVEEVVTSRQSQGRGEGRGGNRRPNDRNNRDESRRSGPGEPRTGKQADGQKQAAAEGRQQQAPKQRGEKQPQASKQDKQQSSASKPQVQAQVPKPQQQARSAEKPATAAKPAVSQAATLASTAAPVEMDVIDTPVGSPVIDQALVTSQLPADGAVTDDANGDGGNKRRRGRRGGRRRRRGAGEAGGIAGEDGMLDQDGGMDEALNADGSQPEFDFDDIEAPVQPKVAASSAVTTPVAAIAVVQVPAEERAVDLVIPSPALEAVEAVAMALEASDSAPAQVEAIPVPVEEASAFAESPDVASDAAPAEPTFIAAPEAPVASPDNMVAARADDTIAAFEPSLEPAAAVADTFVEPEAEPVPMPEPAVAAVAAEAPAEATTSIQADPTSSEVDPGRRAEQLRGLFDTARVTPEGNQAVAGRDYDVDGTSRRP